MGNMGNLSTGDYKSLAAQISDLASTKGRRLAWTGRLAIAADHGADWMEFSVLGKSEETVILRLEGGTVQTMPAPAPAVEARMAS